MPQISSKCQIIIDDIIHVSPMRGISFIKNHLIAPTFEKTPDHQKGFTNVYDEASLSKNIFYECSLCKGPLVPVSTCTCCKKATVRKCAKCNAIKNVPTHETCQNLVSYVNIVSHKSLSVEI